MNDDKECPFCKEPIEWKGGKCWQWDLDGPKGEGIAIVCESCGACGPVKADPSDAWDAMPPQPDEPHQTSPSAQESYLALFRKEGAL